MDVVVSALDRDAVENSLHFGPGEGTLDADGQAAAGLPYDGGEAGPFGGHAGGNHQILTLAAQAEDPFDTGPVHPACGACIPCPAAASDVGRHVSRGGRPDLAGEALADVRAPVLLIVGGADTPVIGLNREAARRLRCVCRLEIMPDATHLFEEPGALDRVADLAADRFEAHLRQEAAR